MDGWDLTLENTLKSPVTEGGGDVGEGPSKTRYRKRWHIADNYMKDGEKQKVSNKFNEYKEV